MSTFWFIAKRLWAGKSVTRAYLDYRLSDITLRGRVIDIGGGGDDQRVSFMKRADDAQFYTYDVKTGQDVVDFETDRLPADDGAYDTVLFLNVMEHIFNYQHIANEVVRITKPGGQLIGFVPFLMWYHADPNDFFRYTHQTLERIFDETGATDVTIEVIGGGPFIAAAQMLMSSIPLRPLRPFLFVPFYALDWLFHFIKGKHARPYALGYFFIIKP